MPYRAPTSITRQPGVAECIAPDGGFLEVEEGGPRHDVLLKDGWSFSALERDEHPRRSARFRTVAEFHAARPVRRTNIEAPT